MKAFFSKSIAAAVLFAGVNAFGAEVLDRDHGAKMEAGLKLFQGGVRQTLLDQCFKCHGGEQEKGDFNISTRELLLKGGAEGVAVVPGKPGESKLVKMIGHAERPFMPKKGEKLSDSQVEQISKWIELGAPYDKPLGNKLAKDKSKVTEQDRNYWAFKPLSDAEVPRIKEDSWSRNDVDRFVLGKLKEKGITPNKVADKLTLARRAYFDLVGLPPKPEEIETFLKDDSSEAYSRLIDRLLSSPHYGERWARHWLDVSRFAESHGFEHDYDRPYAYHFRDFVIQALNQDMPYDQFVKWQLAGDEYAPDEPLAMMATGFLGAGVFPTQITANEVERTRYDALDDMSATMGTAMLGLTVGCARCHDHKFDPIPAADYYRLLSSFTTTVRSEIDLDLDPKAHKEAKAKWEKERAPLVEELKRYEDGKFVDYFAAWLQTKPSVPAGVQWTVVDSGELKSAAGTTFRKQDDYSFLATGKNENSDTYTFSFITSDKNISAFRVEALADSSLPHKGPGRADNGNFALSKIRAFVAAKSNPAVSNEVKLINAKADFEQNKEQLSVASSLDDNAKSGWAVDGQIGKSHAAVFHTAEPVGNAEGSVVTLVLSFEVNTRHGIGRPRFSYRNSPAPAPLDGTEVAQSLHTGLAEFSKSGELSGSAKTKLMGFFRTLDPIWKELNAKVESHAKNEPKPKLTKVQVTSEGFTPMRHHTQGADFFKETYFLNRGDNNQKKGVAPQGFLQVLMRAPEGEKKWVQKAPDGWRTSYRRRGLAEWVMDTEQGAGHLAARVMVNRLWQHHFGRGIVATPNDFGLQGPPPTHPELLDYLAKQFIAHGWSLKQMHKLMMTSAAYMQSSAANGTAEKLDPENVFFGRRVARRLEAEIVRDAMLAASETLDRAMYGPGTLDQNHKRRSIYFTVKRSQLVPMMQLFDAPEPLVSIGSRPETTIAPQALLFMNSPQVREYAINFGRKLASMDHEQAINRGYQTALGRLPTKGELADTVEFLKGQTASYQAVGNAQAKELACADFCQVLFGLNDFIYVN